MSVTVTVLSMKNGTYHLELASFFYLLYHAVFIRSFCILTVLTAHFAVWGETDRRSATRRSQAVMGDLLISINDSLCV